MNCSQMLKGRFTEKYAGLTYKGNQKATKSHSRLAFSAVQPQRLLFLSLLYSQAA